jgi:hypothetical protein
MRLGGIYALEGVMNGSAQYQQAVLEALCAFVRNSTIGMIVSDSGLATDIQTTLTVIGRRSPGPGKVGYEADAARTDGKGRALYFGCPGVDTAVAGTAVGTVAAADCHLDQELMAICP